MSQENVDGYRQAILEHDRLVVLVLRVLDGPVFTEPREAAIGDLDRMLAVDEVEDERHGWSSLGGQQTSSSASGRIVPRKRSAPAITPGGSDPGVVSAQ
jgi:hypothetical protein